MSETIEEHIASRGGDRALLEGDLRSALLANAAAADEVVELQRKLTLAVHACRLAATTFGGEVIDEPITPDHMRRLEVMLHLQAVVEDNPWPRKEGEWTDSRRLARTRHGNSSVAS